MTSKNIDIIKSARNADLLFRNSDLDLTMNPVKDGWFEEGFNHDSTETDATAGWPGFQAWTGTIGSVTNTWGFPTRFKATHCSLIPKGAHRGRLLLWNTDIVVASADATDGNLWSWQALVIYDPAPNAAIRFRNYLLPVAPATTTGAGFYPSLFCAGHAWTEFGDLVIAGGNAWNNSFQLGVYDKFWIWNPDHAGAIYLSDPATNRYKFYATGHYSEIGAWVYCGSMKVARWYATVKTTPRYASLSNRSCVLFFGGSVNVTSSTPGVDNANAWNSYEAYAVTQSPTVTAPSSHSTGLVLDNRSVSPYSIAPGIFKGPSTTTPVTEQSAYEESLIFYAWMHQLSDGSFFMAGMAPKSARLANHGTNPGQWTLNPGYALAGSWQKERMYGCSVELPNYDGVSNRIIRLGGQNYRTAPLDTTDEVQYLSDATNAGSTWVTWPALDVPAAEANLVITPDAKLYLFGGTDKFLGTPAAVTGHIKSRRIEPDSDGSGWDNTWEQIYWSPAETYRDYHSSAMLLPDGRIFTGGGDSFSIVVDPTAPSHAHNPTASDHPGYDYEIFYPSYLRPSEYTFIDRPRPVITSVTGSTPSGGTYPMSYGVSYTVNCAALENFCELSHIVLMAPGSRTHHYDFSEKYHKPTSQSVASATSRTFTFPATDNILPRGYYMLFVVDNFGTPSEAIWIKV